MPRRSTPEERTEQSQKSVKRIKRKYKVALNKPKKLLTGEKAFYADMSIVLKLGGYSHSQIGSVLGISRGQVKELLSDEKVAERLVQLQSNLPAAALDLLHGYSIEAATAILDVMRSAEDDAIILKAAAEILDRVGIAKVSKTEAMQFRTTETKTTIGAEEGLVESIRQLSPEKQEEAAVMIENLEKFLHEATGDEGQD